MVRWHTKTRNSFVAFFFFHQMLRCIATFLLSRIRSFRVPFCIRWNRVQTFRSEMGWNGFFCFFLDTANRSFLIRDNAKQNILAGTVSVLQKAFGVFIVTEGILTDLQRMRQNTLLPWSVPKHCVHFNPVQDTTEICTIYRSSCFLEIEQNAHKKFLYVALTTVADGKCSHIQFLEIKELGICLCTPKLSTSVEKCSRETLARVQRTNRNNDFHAKFFCQDVKTRHKTCSADWQDTSVIVWKGTPPTLNFQLRHEADSSWECPEKQHVTRKHCSFCSPLALYENKHLYKCRVNK